MACISHRQVPGPGRIWCCALSSQLPHSSSSPSLLQWCFSGQDAHVRVMTVAKSFKEAAVPPAAVQAGLMAQQRPQEAQKQKVLLCVFPVELRFVLLPFLLPAG